MKHIFNAVILASVVLSCGVTLAKAQAQCTVEGEFVPHTDCTKYYVCTNFQLIELECSEGLYFNPEAGWCDFPNQVPECVGGTRPPVGPTSTAPPSTTTQPPSTTTQPPSTTTEPPSTTTQPPSTTTQPPSTTTPTPPPSTTTPAVTTTTEEIPETEPTEPVSSSTLPPGQCPPTGIAKIAHETLCNAYYTCVDGIRYEPYQVCPEGLLFDPKIGECNLPSEVDCTPVTTVPTTTSERPNIPECPPSGVHQLPYPGNCTLFILCVEEVPILYRCPDGQLFDTARLTCLPEGLAVCTVEGFGLYRNQNQNLIQVNNVHIEAIAIRPRPIERFGVSQLFQRFFRN